MYIITFRTISNLKKEMFCLFVCWGVCLFVCLFVCGGVCLFVCFFLLPPMYRLTSQQKHIDAYNMKSNLDIKLYRKLSFRNANFERKKS